MIKSESKSFLSKKISRKIGRAMGDYGMLAEGDRVLVAVSGGVDSCVLAWVLQTWQARAPIDYSLKCVYIDDGFWKGHGGMDPIAAIAEIMAKFEVEFCSVPAKSLGDEQRTCFLCARNRRALLFDLAQKWDMNKIALGHHMDDLVETLYLNMLYSGNISTMLPKQKLFGGELHLIRPLAYMEKKEVRKLASDLRLQPIPNLCPVEKDNRRDTVREVLAEIYRREPGAKKSIFRAMGNIRMDYILQARTER